MRGNHPPQHHASNTVVVNNICQRIIGRQHRKDIDLNLKPFRGNNNINNYIFHTKKNVQFKTSNKYLLLLLYTYDNVRMLSIIISILSINVIPAPHVHRTPSAWYHTLVHSCVAVSHDRPTRRRLIIYSGPPLCIYQLQNKSPNKRT